MLTGSHCRILPQPRLCRYRGVYRVLLFGFDPDFGSIWKNSVEPQSKSLKVSAASVVEVEKGI